MSRFVDIKNNDPVEVIIDKIKNNPAGGIFRFNQSGTRNDFMRKFNKKTIEWIKRNPETPDPYHIFIIAPIDKCNLIIQLNLVVPKEQLEKPKPPVVTPKTNLLKSMLNKGKDNA